MPAKLSSNEEYALQQTAAALGVKRDSLYNLIQFESGWNPKATNPLSGARGLIQFMPKTAEGMGYSGGIFSTAADALVNEHDTRVKQLQGPVLAYLSKYKPFRGTDQDLFMSVFHAAKDKSDTTFYRRSENIDAPFPSNVPAQNPGIYTPRDYVNKLYRAIGLSPLTTVVGGSSIFLIAAAVVVGYLATRKR